jgi:hypothetical protein
MRLVVIIISIHVPITGVQITVERLHMIDPNYHMRQQVALGMSVQGKTPHTLKVTSTVFNLARESDLGLSLLQLI